MKHNLKAATNPLSGIEQYFSLRLPEMATAVGRLIEFESPSNDVAALNRTADALGTYIMSMLGQAPLIVRSGPERRPHLRVDLGERTDVLLIGHFDTVHPVGTLAKNPVRIDEGRIYGPGALDMKGGIVSMVEIARRLQLADSAPNVTLFFNSDEEIGSKGSGSFLREIAARARVSLIFDYGDSSGSVRNGARGVRHLRLSVRGKGGHAAYPEHNRNPIEGIAKIVTASAQRNADLREVSVSPTRIQGSDGDNVVADVASVLFDIRGQTVEQIDAAHHFLETFDLSADGLEIEAEIVSAVVPFTVTPHNEAVWAAEEAALQLGWEPIRFTQERGASDANTIASVTDSLLVGLGGWGDGAHSPDREYLAIESLQYFATLGGMISELVLSDAVPNAEHAEDAERVSTAS